jgi:cobalt-zinc-cadmium efflux system outer membrane protein
MKYKNIIILPVLILIIFTSYSESLSQSSLDHTLDEISKNNKSLIANNQYLQSKKLESRVGNSLYNPFVEITNLFGAADNQGDQTEIKVIQSFDFPTSYGKRNKVADLKISQTAYEQDILRQDILLEAKFTCIELIYLNKKKKLLLSRTESMKTLLDLFQIKMDKGEGNILDVNKAKINLLNSNSELLVLENKINELNQKLTELNGGNKIVFNDTLYPVVPVIPDFADLERTIENADPHRKFIIQEKQIYQSQVELSKALSLPKLELGYYYLGLTNQNFNGIHLGFSLPLWENNYRSDFYRSRSLSSDLELESHDNEHFYEIKKQYDQYEVLKNVLNEYQLTLESINSEELLLNALNFGEISILEYFVELSFYYTSVDKYLEMDMEYNKVLAELFKYQL